VWHAALPALWHHHGAADQTLEETMPTQLPAAWVSAGYGVPTVCARHGQPGTLRARTEFESAPAGWSYAFIPLGLLVFVLIRAATRKRIDAPVWYYCDSCRSMRPAPAFAAAAEAALEHARNQPPVLAPPIRTHEQAAREIFGHTMPRI
jgi:hypothetical protein